MRVLSLAARRLAASLPTLLIILAGMFLLLQLAPGDTVDALIAQMGGGGDAAMAEETAPTAALVAAESDCAVHGWRPCHQRGW